MTPRGPSPLGGDPDDRDGSPSDDQGHDHPPAGAGDDGRLNGWVPPEQRAWRHPSEVLGRGTAGPRTAYDQGPVRPLRHRPHLTALVASGAVVAVLAGVFLLVNAGPMGTSDLSTTATTMAGFTASSETEPAAAARTARSLVALTVVTGHGTEQGCAVAVAADGVLATTADTVVGASSVTALTADGQQVRATIVAVDTASDIALLEVPVRLPVPRFLPDATVVAGRPAMVLALARPLGPGAAREAIATWSFGTVDSVGTVTQPGPGPGMAALVARVAGGPELPGEVLADPTGAVLGMFAHPASGSSVQLFIPSDLLLGVSTDLVQSGRVEHGWLDVDGADLPASSPPRSGALVDSVVAHGASVDQLQAGDVIVAVDGLPVRSMAELRARLYVLAAGTPVTLEVVRHGATTSVTVSLAPSP